MSNMCCHLSTLDQIARSEMLTLMVEWLFVLVFKVLEGILLLILNLVTERPKNILRRKHIRLKQNMNKC
jgi:hypothetical protein